VVNGVVPSAPALPVALLDVLDGLPCATLLLDGALRCRFFNRAAEALTGLAREEVLGRRVLERVIVPESVDTVTEGCRAVAAGAPVAQGLCGVQAREGAPRLCEWHATPLPFAGEARGVLCVWQDATEHIALARELGAAADRFQRFVRNIHEALWTADEAGTAVYISPAITAIYGYSPADIYRAGHRLWFDRVHPGDRDRVRSSYAALFREGRPFDEEYRVLHRDGRWVWWHDRATSVYEAEGRRLTDGILSDITARKAVEAALRESEESHRLLFEANPEPMWVYDRETLRFLAVNDAAVRHYGWSREAFLRMRITDIRPSEDVPRLLADVAHEPEGLRETGLWRHRTSDGSLIDVEITGHTLEFAGRPAVLVLSRDVTERRALEEQLRHAQKMEAMGQLTGGIAHDLNNVLTAIIAHLDLALAGLDERDGQARADVQQALETARSSGQMIKKLLAFSRRERLAIGALDLRGAVEDLAVMLRRMLPPTIVVEVEVAGEGPVVAADAGALQQMVLNLAANARDAMPHGGRLVLRVERREPPASTPGAGRGAYVCLQVRDTGHGMAPQTVERAFEPFFTTKPSGAGTGLGLAMVYGLMQHHRGFVDLQSRPGEGTTVRLFFPAITRPPLPVEAGPGAALPRGTGTVLLVEDEPAVRRAALRALELAGYTVLVAADGREGLELFHRHRDAIALVVTDVAMPHLSGSAMREAILRERPDVPVLVTSGFQGAEAGPDLTVPFLPKPWTIFELLDAVRRLLADRETAEPPAAPGSDG
jgi:hypothetical protein